MKKLSKLTSALLALLMIMSLFAACGKDNDKKDDSEKDKTTVQVLEEDIEETTEEEHTTEAEVTTKTEETTKEDITIKIPNVTKAPVTKVPATKAPNTTKVPGTTKAPSTTQAPSTTKAPTTKPDVTQKEEPKPTNIDALVGTWETTIVSDGLPVTLQFKFEANGTVQMDFTKASYDKMIKKAVDTEMSQITDEEIAEAGFESRKEAEDYLYEFLTQEAPYDQLRSMLQNTGTWTLSGDTLTVTIDGEPATAQTKLSEGKTSFELKDPTGESITLTKI